MLIGMPGSGKTTVARLLAKRLSAKFVDTDALIEERSGATVAEIFAEHGEPQFRELERQVVLSLMEATNTVIGTGGGTVIDPENWNHLSALGTTVYLKATAETLAKRLAGKADRPLLSLFEPGVKLSRGLGEVLKKRSAFYERADFTVKVDTREIDEIADLILEHVRN